MFVLVHGGAGFKRPSKKSLAKLSESLECGYSVLHHGSRSLHAVVETIKVLEDSGLFNAGAGGNLQLDGVRRLDASVMEGSTLQAGSVIGLERIRNPIEAAKTVMELPHVTLTHNGAIKIAAAKDLPQLPEPGKGQREKVMRMLRKNRAFHDIYNRYFSTVGAVALDSHGNLAAGSSTGGLPLMLPGRVGDTPIIGAGIYADNSQAAIACTGTGEYIIRLSLAKEVCMNLGKMSPQRAALHSLRRLKRLGGEAGIILLNRKGKFVIMHTTAYMPSGYASGKGIVVMEAFKGICPL
jgi:beta-aspartyl-peptidase (threonine type)